MARALPGFSLATVFGLAGSAMGAALSSPLLGQCIEWFSPRVLPSILLGVTLIGLGLSLVIYFVTKRLVRISIVGEARLFVEAIIKSYLEDNSTAHHQCRCL